MTKHFRIALVTLALVGCGRTAELEPQAGKSLPQKPALASAPLDAEALLELTPNAAPKRVDELNKKGEVRSADRFDLPPPDSDAPTPSAATSEGATPSTTGPDNQEPQR